MTYQQLAYFLLDTIKGGPYPLTRSVLDETDPGIVSDIISDILDYADRRSQIGAPVFTAEQFSRARVLQDWPKYRDQPAAAFIDGGVK
jgi:hypothetical protein